MSAAAATRSATARPPLALMAVIAAAWTFAIAAEVSGNADRLHHDTLIGQGPPLWLALTLSLATWQAMTAAMMLPSSLPLVRLFAHVCAGQPNPRKAMGGFLAGYALVWTGFAAVAFLGDAALHRLIESSPSLHRHEWVIGGTVLLLAGAYQFTALKDSCLRQCRTPGAFMLRYYERGVGGGFRVGARHGLFCVGCCWALMLVMFAVGVASLVWMAIFTFLMVFEKTRPIGARSVPVTGTALLCAGVGVLMYSGYAAGVFG